MKLTSIQQATPLRNWPIVKPTLELTLLLLSSKVAA